MLAYLIKPVLMLKNYEFGRAVNSVFSLIMEFCGEDSLLARLQSDTDFCGEDLTMFLQQCHLIVFHRPFLPDPSLFFLTQVMIAHCVRSVSKPEHCLAISSPSETKHLFSMTSMFLSDENFVQSMFHKKHISVAKFIPFVLPFIDKPSLKALCVNHSLPELKVTVLKRVHHQVVHKAMLKHLRNLVTTMIHAKELESHVLLLCFNIQQTVQNILEIIFTESMKCTKLKKCEKRKFLEEFLLRIKRMNPSKRLINFEFIARVTAMSQSCVMLYSVLNLYDKRCETPLYKRFLIGKGFDEGYTNRYYLDQLEVIEKFH